MTTTFDLTTAGFIPCQSLDGRGVEYGIRETLLRAADLREIRADSPLVTLALHRLLLAVLHDAIQGPTSEKHWRQLWDASELPADAVTGYLARHNDRFDLFHPEYPFFQTQRLTTGTRSGVNKLSAAIAETNVKFMFSHVSDDDPPLLSFAEAARQLVAHQLTTGQGGRGYGASPLSRGAYVLLIGDTLFETLLFNLPRYKVGDNDPLLVTDQDAPVWASQRPAASSPEEPDGLLDLYTWQSRSLLLHPEPDGTGVRWMTYSAGRMFRPAATIYDPSVAYREAKNGQVRAVAFDKCKAGWRDSGALLEFGAEKRHRRPPVAEFLGRATRDLPAFKGRTIQLCVLGALTDSAKVLFWRHDTLPLPAAYLADGNLVHHLKRALELAEQVGSRAVRAAVYKAVVERLTGSAESAPDGKRVAAVTDSLAADRRYWSELEGPYRRLITDLAAAPDRDSVLRGWFDNTLKRTAHDAFDDTVGRLDGGRCYKAVTAGRGVLLARLAQIGKPLAAPEVSTDA